MLSRRIYFLLITITIVAAIWQTLYFPGAGFLRLVQLIVTIGLIFYLIIQNKKLRNELMRLKEERKSRLMDFNNE